ncbi:MAG: hypothetical protein CMJ75_18975 [Planctomycetaceae bacterium]|nr:hypothetical protein [Planctomycetaceae bacterium]
MSSGASLEFTRLNEHTIKTADGRYWVVRGGKGEHRSFLAYYKTDVIGSNRKAQPMIDLCNEHNKTTGSRPA